MVANCEETAPAEAANNWEAFPQVVPRSLVESTTLLDVVPITDQVYELENSVTACLRGDEAQSPWLNQVCMLLDYRVIHNLAT